MRHRYSDFSSSETATESPVFGRVTRETSCSKPHDARTNIPKMMDFNFIGRAHDQNSHLSFPSSRDKGYRITGMSASYLAIIYAHRPKLAVRSLTSWAGTLRTVP